MQKTIKSKVNTDWIFLCLLMHNQKTNTQISENIQLYKQGSADDDL